MKENDLLELIYAALVRLDDKSLSRDELQSGVLALRWQVSGMFQAHVGREPREDLTYENILAEALYPK